MKQGAFSYHMFAYPFIWNTGKGIRSGKLERKNDSNILVDIFETPSESNIWERMQDDLCQIRDGIDLNNDRRKNYYCAFQFFNEAGKSIVFDEAENNLVSTFQLKKSEIDSGEYVITLGNVELRLEIDQIYLKIFNTGVAVFYMECVNYLHRSLEEVKMINEYGRRMSLSFWPQNADAYKKCADKLSLVKCGEEFLCDDFRSFILQADSGKNKVSLLYVSTIIRDLLSKNGKGIRFRAKSPHGKEIQISPILDGKMYVSCCICDSGTAKWIKQAFDASRNTFSVEQIRNIAELINVDLEGKCAYQNETACREYLEKHIHYWQYGGDAPVLLGITEQACIKILEPKVNDDGTYDNQYEINYHNTIYNQIIIIGIVQRMSIANYQQQIAKITYGIGTKNKKMNNNLIFKIMELQERYIAFQSQFLLYEVTAQREGTYIYNKIQQELHVHEENELLTNRLNAIYELANMKQGYGFNKGALILSMVALVCTIFSAISEADGLGRISFSTYTGIPVLAMELLICIGIIGYIVKIKYKK